GPWSGVVGVQARVRSFAAVGEEAFVQPTKLNSVGLFIYEDTDWNNFHFEIGGRYEFQNIEPTETSGINDIDHDTYSVSFGSIYSFTDRYSAGLSVSRAQRAPTIEELIADGPHHATETFEIGNPFLDEETANNIDFSIQRNDDVWSWKVNLFANYIEDYVFQQFQDLDGDGEVDEVDEDGNPGGELRLIRFVADDALFYGAEFETSYHMEIGANHLDFRLFTDVVRGELDGGEDLPRISPARVGLGLDYSRNRWDANMDIINVFEQDDTADLEEGTGGYVMLNAGLSYTLPVKEANARFFVRGTNLLDKDARRHTSFIKERAPLPGRAAIMGVQFSY
ncbi:MAG: TonB-dependent receptor, partial [Thiotrichales bacterium]|nr:TonB-dependent receptor [Thiotrichales bacterium]